MLGVLIGVAAVIILLAVGTGSSQAVQNRINALGTNTITVLSRGRFGRGPATTGTQSQSANLTLQSVQAIEDPSQAPDVESRLAGRLDDRDRDLRRRELLDLGDRHDARLPDRRGLHASPPAARSPQADVTDRRRVALVGQTVLSNLFSTGENPLGQTIQLGSASFEIIGVLAEKGTLGDDRTRTAS